MNTLRRLFSHLQWADTRVGESLRSTGATPRALELYAHVLAAEHIWLARLREQPPRYAVWPKLDIAECMKLAQETAAAYGAYLADLAADALAREVPYTNSAGQVFRSRIDDILLHVALHGRYHRGQIALLVREGGGTPAPTDYIGFVRGVPAATRLPPD